MASSFGVAALAIGAVAIALNWPPDGAVTPQVDGVIVERDDPDPATDESNGEAVSSSTTTTVIDETTTSTDASTSAAPTADDVIPPTAIDMVDLAALATTLGELSLTAFSEDVPEPGAPFSFAVRIENMSVIAIPIDVIGIMVTVDGEPIDDVVFLAGHDSIPGGESATGTVRINMPESGGIVDVGVTIGDAVLGSAIVG